jgi:hypothetical protein
MTEQNIIQQQLVARAMKDEAFRERLLSSPKETLERELGIMVPTGVTIQVHQDTPSMLHLVLPTKQSSGEMQELSDAELEQVAGGSQVTGDCGTQAPLTHCDTDNKCQGGKNIY